MHGHGERHLRPDELDVLDLLVDDFDCYVGTRVFVFSLHDCCGTRIDHLTFDLILVERTGEALFYQNLDVKLLLHRRALQK